jgi:hypothetical protein
MTVCTGDGRSGSYCNFRFTCFICESLINAVSLKLFHRATCLLPWLCLDSKKVFGIALWWLGTISGQTMIFYVTAFSYVNNNEDYFNWFSFYIEKTQLISCEHRVYVGLSILHWKNKTFWHDQKVDVFFQVQECRSNK